MLVANLLPEKDWYKTAAEQTTIQTLNALMTANDLSTGDRTKPEKIKRLAEWATTS